MNFIKNGSPSNQRCLCLFLFVALSVTGEGVVYNEILLQMLCKILKVTHVLSLSLKLNKYLSFYSHMHIYKNVDSCLPKGMSKDD